MDQVGVASRVWILRCAQDDGVECNNPIRHPERSEGSTMNQATIEPRAGFLQPLYFTSGLRAAGIRTEATIEPARTVPMMPSEKWIGMET